MTLSKKITDWNRLLGILTYESISDKLRELSRLSGIRIIRPVEISLFFVKIVMEAEYPQDVINLLGKDICEEMIVDGNRITLLLKRELEENAHAPMPDYYEDEKGKRLSFYKFISPSRSGGMTGVAQMVFDRDKPSLIFDPYHRFRTFIGKLRRNVGDDWNVTYADIKGDIDKSKYRQILILSGKQGDYKNLLPSRLKISESAVTDGEGILINETGLYRVFYEKRFSNDPDAPSFRFAWSLIDWTIPIPEADIPDKDDADWDDFWHCAAIAFRDSKDKNASVKSLKGIVGNHPRRAMGLLKEAARLLNREDSSLFRTGSYENVFFELIIPEFVPLCLDEEVFTMFDGSYCYDRWFYGLIDYLGKHYPEVLRSQNEIGETPMNRYVVNFSVNTLLLYLKYVPEVVDIPDNKGVTPLFKTACDEATIPLFEKLVELGADPYHRNHSGDGIFVYALKTDIDGVFESITLRDVLEKYTDFSRKDEYGSTLYDDVMYLIRDIDSSIDRESWQVHDYLEYLAERCKKAEGDGNGCPVVNH